MQIAQIVGVAPPVRCPYGEEVAVGEVIHSFSTVAAWTEECRNASGLFTIQPPAAAPEGQRIASTDLALVDGLVIEVATYETLPASRRLIAKDVVMTRLDAAGLVDTAQAALLRRPVLFGRWFNKDWPEVYADDAAMLAVLTAVGADVETITAP